ncbi:YgiT-type zinc finger protein [Paenibacillus endoradicis]|uniref:YgiT-type zinc finger protein n=1 Tax=Paenibacillus endoradicis TaxID=2972487 RepID=UPI002159A05E|nr:YgiT-type zinc finger protein [Paenibacillus endoradicis]MCR8659311.1 YgiT-type zinc finger protein [Paenibacillus endoradicis]
MMGNKDNRDENVPDSFEGKTLEELWAMVYGEKELEERKVLRQRRMLKSDYGEGESNLISCPSCDSDDVPNADIDFPLATRNNKIRSIKIRGAKCSSCGEEYINGREVRAIEKVLELFEELFPEKL